MKLMTLQTSRSSSCDVFPWVSKTPQNPTETSSQSEYIKNQIVKHHNSSPSALYNAMNQFAKNAHNIMHQIVFLKEKNTKLHETNQILNQHYKAKKTQLQHEGTLTVQDAQDLQSQKDVTQQIQKEEHIQKNQTKRKKTREKRCGRCNQPGHNARTCNINVKNTSEEESD